MSRCPHTRRWLAILTVACLAAFAAPAAARGASADAAPAAISASATDSGAHVRELGRKSDGHCSVLQKALNLLNPLLGCNPLSPAGQTITKTVEGLPGRLAGSVATGVMDQVTSWMVGAAQTITGWVFKEAAVITKPQLDASWYLSLFSGLAVLGGALAGLVALIALGSAAIRRDPDALGEVLYGIGRAGIGTSIVVALTIIALTAADGIANGFAHEIPADFYKTLASQWGGSGWGGFGAAALAFLVAFVATIAGLLVWLELIVREAAIYIAVLFFPVALAASIWPALRMWVRRLGMLLLMFVMLRPVVVIVLALAGSVTSAGFSFGNGSIPRSVGTILAGVVIFALAAFTPWVLMFLVGTEVGALSSRAAAQAGGTTSAGKGASRGAGGALSGGAVIAGGGEPALAGASAGDGSSTGGGMRLSSLGGSGANGAQASSGPVAAAAGWVGGVAGAVGRAGGHVSQHAAARIHAASGRGGVAPAGTLPPSGGPGGANRSANGSDGSRPPQVARGGSPDPPSFADTINQPPASPTVAPIADPPSPADSRRASPPPAATEAPTAPLSHGPPVPPPASPTDPPDRPPAPGGGKTGDQR